ncbi:DUF4349 domain-containing protein [Hymenobacter sp. BT683]|uniref:DUF4349 domain-containing protein n=1 Tax=Hymenobacter jeongseonensis TaxID=2791027 RepID=A0ABS0IHX2_9BACT|nr:DUF4349 domain-containing protein [Hymenobacter jeongseonensis]MBF9237518.1 DUF4349 domain-containing protein [Hymenobacter jeongseonensis]
MKYTLGILLGLAALLSSCSRANEEKSAIAVPAKEMMMNAPPPSMEADKELNEGMPGPTLATPTAAVVAPARLLIYHADLRLKVENLPQASKRLDSLVQRNGGFLSAANEVREEEEWRQAMTIRVLPSRFRAMMAALGNLGTVEEKKLTTDDVTAQHADIAARLRTKRIVEQRYIALLARAKKISDVLEVEQKIGEVREEIESTESRIKTLNDEVAYSTISLVCYQPLAQPIPDAPVVSFSSRLVDSFYTGWTLITSVLIGVVAIWPFLLLGSAAWWAVKRWRRRLA